MGKSSQQMRACIGQIVVCSSLTWIDQELNKNWDAVERDCMWEIVC